MQSNKPKRKLVAILFADIIGYTALMQTDEVTSRRNLEKFRDTLNEKVVHHNGEVVQYYGDGCLCTFDSAVNAMACAKIVQQTFQTAPKVPVRIGIHSGDAFFEADNVFGDSVNIASRIESLGVEGAVLFSKQVQKHIANQKEFKAQSLGSFDFKNVEEPMEVFALANEGFVIPKRGEMKGKLSPKKQKGFKWQVPLVIGVLLALAIGYFFNKNKTVTISDTIPSIAVLPFNDMSVDKDQEYFAEGIAEEILNTLGQLKELRVAGRTSSFSFKDKGATIAEIGKALNVNHVIEGSVRKHGDKIRITAQLVNVEDGYHLWSNKYDRSIQDIFAIQEEVAANIGEVLLKKLVPEQLANLHKNFKPNSEAYDLFLKAKHIHLNKYTKDLKIENFNLSEKLFLNAIKLDSNYASAHAGLADLYDTRLSFLSDSLEIARYDSLRVAAINIAYQLNPESAYVNEVMGFVLGKPLSEIVDIEAAVKSFIKSYELNPNSANCFEGLAKSYMQMGLFEDAMIFFDRAIQLDPLSSTAHLKKMIAVSEDGGDTAAGLNILHAVLEIEPDNLWALELLAKKYAFLGRKKEAFDTYEKMAQIDPTYMKRVPLNSMIYAILKGDKELMEDSPKDDLSLVDSQSFLDFLSGDMVAFEKSYLKRYEMLKKKKSFAQSSLYTKMMNNPMTKVIRDKSWFQEILKIEKEKYDRFYEAFPRAEEIIGKPFKG